MWTVVAERIVRGEAVEVRPTGESMTPIVWSRQFARMGPVDLSHVLKEDVVLEKVAGLSYLHLVSAVQGDRVRISNNHGHVNG